MSDVSARRREIATELARLRREQAHLDVLDMAEVYLPRSAGETTTPNEHFHSDQ